MPYALQSVISLALVLIVTVLAEGVVVALMDSRLFCDLAIANVLTNPALNIYLAREGNWNWATVAVCELAVMIAEGLWLFVCAMMRVSRARWTGEPLGLAQAMKVSVCANVFSFALGAVYAIPAAIDAFARK